MTPQNPSTQPSVPNLALSNRIALLLSQRLSAAQSLSAPQPSSETTTPTPAPFSSLGASASTNGSRKTGSANPPPPTASKRQRYEDEDDLRSAGDPNAGIGMDASAPKTGDAAKKEEALALKRRLLGKRRREDDGPAPAAKGGRGGRGGARAEDSSDEEMGRSALGKKKARHTVTAYSGPIKRRGTDTRGSKGTTNGTEPAKSEPAAVAIPAEKVTAETTGGDEDQEMGGMDSAVPSATDGATASEVNGAQKKKKRKKKKKTKAEKDAAETPSQP